MRPGRAWHRLKPQVFPAMPTPSCRNKLLEEPDFEHPPLWIHASIAARCFLAAGKAAAVLARQPKRALRETPARK